jgi:hypothetical protein
VEVGQQNQALVAEGIGVAEGAAGQALVVALLDPFGLRQ